MYFYYSVSSEQCSSINTIVIQKKKIFHLSLDFSQIQEYFNTISNHLFCIFKLFYNLLDIQ